MDRAQELLSRMKQGSCKVVGGHVFFTDPSISAAMATFGYDFIWIDGEHGPFDKQNLLMHVIAVNEGGSAAFVRVPVNDPAVIKPVLEMGIDGIIIPMVLTQAEAQAAVAACLYPPEGIRGFGPRRAIKYGKTDIKTYLETAKESFLRIIQIEHVTAVENIEAILCVEGLDAIIIGPNDLSASLDLLGQSTHPQVLQLGSRVIKAAKNAGKPVGVSIGPDEAVIGMWMEMGVDFISVGDDISFLQQGAARTLGFVSRQAERIV
ncbi:2,4-dihydroxyhept-2-ene-1,7-dioic acid aldolase [Sphaerochaeta pleomorpha str. Grapes]|uniref:2,4-dihydroxyhept-2-ene-1,7-dioic acid aldolase n=1 Tax=Sphaerochaeta pleomorpha (strain ATCC BAA-1885 / DSM 22778 / Grapes) TaxID=158190 RepID=G8QV94_SPHPG|nr:aldolase/citrate lyase family protein [Sphaerochaeta pleomorpha]AEV30409.1 2,4-dihydroxyhept-2-ene-1,7-dioic acid aldolase [Sphaerochaeta pleomorpha str. Grapes]